MATVDILVESPHSANSVGFILIQIYNLRKNIVKIRKKEGFFIYNDIEEANILQCSLSWSTFQKPVAKEERLENDRLNIWKQIKMHLIWNLGYPNFVFMVEIDVEVKQCYIWTSQRYRCNSWFNSEASRVSFRFRLNHEKAVQIVSISREPYSCLWSGNKLIS